MSVQPPFTLLNVPPATQTKANTSETMAYPSMAPDGGRPPTLRLPHFEVPVPSPFPPAHPHFMIPGGGPGHPPFEFKLDGLPPHPLAGPGPAMPAYLYDPGMPGMYPYDRFGNPLDINGARRKNATRETTAALKAWLYEHRKNPYPTKGEKIMLAIISKMTLTQVSTWFANARRRLKKENKMTWSPRNRTGEEDDDDDLDDVTEHHTSKDDLDQSGEGKESPLLPSELNRPGGLGHSLSSTSPRPLACSSPKAPKRPSTSETRSSTDGPTEPKKPKIWSIAETVGITDRKSPAPEPPVPAEPRPEPVAPRSTPVMTSAPAYTYLHPWAQMALAAGLRTSFPSPMPPFPPAFSMSLAGGPGQPPFMHHGFPTVMAQGLPPPMMSFASPRSDSGPSPSSTRTPSQPGRPEQPASTGARLPSPAGSNPEKPPAATV